MLHVIYLKLILPSDLQVTGLAVVSLVCFTTSALVALLTDIPVCVDFLFNDLSWILYLLSFRY